MDPYKPHEMGDPHTIPQGQLPWANPIELESEQRADGTEVNAYRSSAAARASAGREGVGENTLVVATVVLLMAIALLGFTFGVLWLTGGFGPGAGRQFTIPAAWLLVWSVFMAVSIFPFVRRTGRGWLIVACVLNLIWSVWSLGVEAVPNVQAVLAGLYALLLMLVLGNGAHFHRRHGASRPSNEE